MRTTKRFTPKVLDRFRAQRRGTGIFDDYKPWHRVSRGDPASRGRSHLQRWQGRQHELLSDKEWVGLMFAIMTPHVVDIREQFPLSIEPSRHELSNYDIRIVGDFPGTDKIARKLGFKHPRTHGDGQSVPWVMTTDLLITFELASGEKQLLAVAFKAAGEEYKKRTHELLALEKAYWQERNVEWLLITPQQYNHQVALRLRDSIPHALSPSADAGLIAKALAVTIQHQGYSLTRILQEIIPFAGDMTAAQGAFWQGVWQGIIPVDLRRGWRPHLPVHLLPHEDFLDLNPIASRRSAWL